ASAAEGLGRLEGVDSVAKSPDAYNCTAHVYLKPRALPDPARWPEQFRSVVGEAFLFRGVEVSVRGAVAEKDGRLILRAPGVEQPIPRARLRNKLQWNFKRGPARQPEPDERAARRQLAADRKGAPPGPFRAEVTGPLRRAERGFVLEVREFFPQTPGMG